MLKENRFIMGLIMCLAMVCITVLPQPAMAANTPLEHIAKGATVNYGGKNWIIINPSTGCLLLANNESNKSFDPDNTQIFNPNDPNNIGYYLNNNFYNSLINKDWVVSQAWKIGNENNEGGSIVNANIGLLTKSEHETLRGTVLPVAGDGYNWWLLTPCSGNSNSVWCVSNNVAVDSTHASGSYGARPLLYLKSGLFVGAGGIVTDSAGEPSTSPVSFVKYMPEGSYTPGTEIHHDIENNRKIYTEEFSDIKIKYYYMVQFYTPPNSIGDLIIK